MTITLRSIFLTICSGAIFFYAQMNAVEVRVSQTEGRYLRKAGSYAMYKDAAIIFFLLFIADSIKKGQDPVRRYEKLGWDYLLGVGVSVLAWIYYGFGYAHNYSKALKERIKNEKILSVIDLQLKDEIRAQGIEHPQVQKIIRSIVADLVKQ